MSMVDLLIFSSFMNICIDYDNLHIVLLGDNNQLYPVGVGCPYRDLICCNKIRKIELTKNFRSNGDIVPFCDIILNSSRWSLDHNKEDSLTKLYNNDIQYNFVKNYKDIDNELKKLLNKLKREGYVPHRHDKQNIKSYQIITYKNDDCINYSKLVRNLYNTKKSNKKYEINDHIIINNNNYKDKCVYNGDEGTIINKVNSFEYKILLYDGRDMILNESDIKPALAITVHASQGSQYSVIIYVCKNNYFLDSNINYTAYSRAKHKLYLIGDINCFDSEKVRNKSEMRNTFISLEYNNSDTPIPE